MSEDVGNRIVYEVCITGDRAPYKWEVIKLGPGTNSSTLADKGEAETLEAACNAATEAARDVEAKRKHAATKEKIRVLEVDLAKPESPDLEAIPVRETPPLHDAPRPWAAPSVTLDEIADELGLGQN